MKFLKFIFVILMAFMVVAFSGGLSIYSHLCKGELVDIAFFLPPDGCEMIQKNKSNTCSLHESENVCAAGDHIKIPGCCKDHELQLSLEDFRFAEQPISLDFDHLVFSLNNAPVVCATPCQLYLTPPSHGPPNQAIPSGQEIRILVQSFLC